MEGFTPPGGMVRITEEFRIEVAAAQKSNSYLNLMTKKQRDDADLPPPSGDEHDPVEEVTFNTENKQGDYLHEDASNDSIMTDAGSVTTFNIETDIEMEAPQSQREKAICNKILNNIEPEDHPYMKKSTLAALACEALKDGSSRAVHLTTIEADKYASAMRKDQTTITIDHPDTKEDNEEGSHHSIEPSQNLLPF